MSEHEIQNLILDYLNRQPGVFAWRVNSTGIFTNGKWRKKVGFDIPGQADISCVVAPHGKYFAIEVKNPKIKENGLSMEQTAFLNKVKSCGCSSICAWSLDQVIEALKEIRGHKYG